MSPRFPAMVCPICKKPLEPRATCDSPARTFFPFCSERCKLIDLGRWLSGRYSIPVEAPSDPVAPEPGPGISRP